MSCTVGTAVQVATGVTLSHDHHCNVDERPHMKRNSLCSSILIGLIKNIIVWILLSGVTDLEWPNWLWMFCCITFLKYTFVLRDEACHSYITLIHKV